MNITIIGGGKIGVTLANKIIENPENNVTVIEINNDKCIGISEKFNINVINGDASEPSFLTGAGIEDTDLFIVTTGNDEINFVCTELIIKLFNYKKLIVRVNNPKNEEVFEKVGADIIISVTKIISNYMYSGIENFLLESDDNNERKGN